MAIMTLNDTLVLIKSHHSSIERAMRTGNYETIGTFFEAIENAAREGKDYAAAMVADASNAPKAT